MGAGVWGRAHHPCIRVQQPSRHRVRQHSHVYGPGHHAGQPASTEPAYSSVGCCHLLQPPANFGHHVAALGTLQGGPCGYLWAMPPGVFAEILLHCSKCEIKLEGEEPWRFPGNTDDLQIIHTPRHTYGHIVLLHKPSKCEQTFHAWVLLHSNGSAVAKLR